jgi:RES domain-containing protein
MIVYRISKAKYSRDLSGKGAEVNGGRWNNLGRPAIYTSGSVALSTVEVSVHLPLGILPNDYVLISIWMPDLNEKGESTITKLTKLPANWRSYPFPKETQQAGDSFLEKAKTLALQVPSAAVTEDFNFIINPLHPDARQVKITDVRPYVFDQRLFVR